MSGGEYSKGPMGSSPPADWQRAWGWSQVNLTTLTAYSTLKLVCVYATPCAIHPMPHDGYADADDA